PIGSDRGGDKPGRRRDDFPVAVRQVEKIQSQRLAAVFEELLQLLPVIRASYIPEAGRETERLNMLAGVFENPRQILMGDGEVAVDLGDQGRVEFRVPSDDCDAEQKGKNDERRQKRDGEKPEADGLALKERVSRQPKHSTSRTCARWSCAKSQA